VHLGLQLNGESACFEIRDTDIGIPEQDRAHIFERFRRGSNVQTVRAAGSGLGFALAAWIAAHHHTDIRVESTVGLGTSFSWELPLRSKPHPILGPQVDLSARQYHPLIATRA
jgi:signal transduction histidine kinase